MSCLCLGPKNSGKTHLLSSLQCPGSINNTTHSVASVGTNLFTIKLNTGDSNSATGTTSTTAATNVTNTVSIITPSSAAKGKKKSIKPKQQIQVREVGGTMAPMWKNYLTDVNKIMYVVDTSNLCQISASGMFVGWLIFINSQVLRLLDFIKIQLPYTIGVLLYSLLAEPRLQSTNILIALTKMDLAYRQMRNEALLMMQFEKLKKQIRQKITVVETSALTTLGHDEIIKWLAQ